MQSNFARQLQALLAVVVLLPGWATSLPAQQLARFEGLVSVGDSAWRVGRFPEAKAAYREALAVDSVGSSRAVFRLAVLLSWDGDLGAAIPLFQRYSALEPRDEEGRIALAKAYAWNGQTGSAVAVYDSILSRDSTYRDAALGAALALAWAARFDEAVGRYDSWLETSPRDVEAELARARALAWWGKLGAAERTYAEIAERGETVEAEKGLALVAAWRGDLLRSEAIWRRVIERVPRDAEAMTGLAQVLRWAGRSEDAYEALMEALAIDPENSDAAQQLRWVRADLAAVADPSLTVAWDSDDNRTVAAGGGISFRPFRRGRLTLTGSRRRAELGAALGHSSAGRAVLRVGLSRRLALVGDLGATRMTAVRGQVSADRTVGTAGLSATVRVAARLSLGAAARRSAFDETAALLLSGIDVTTVGAEGEWEPFGRVSVAGGVERASLRGGSGPNVRTGGSGAVRWRARRQVTVSVAGRSFGYEVLRRDGYFSPARFQLAETGVRWVLGRDLGWTAVFEGAVGAQRVRLAGPPVTKGTQRFGVSAGFRPSPGSEIGLDYGFSNVSSAASEGTIYRAQVLMFRGRVVF